MDNDHTSINTERATPSMQTHTSKRKKETQSDLNQYFSLKSKQNKRTRSSPKAKLHSTFYSNPEERPSIPRSKSIIKNQEAERISTKLKTKPVYLTNDGSSWYIHAKEYMPSNPKTFRAEWNLHPTKRRELRVYGRIVTEKRWSQAWGLPMIYSGAVNHARSIEESVLIPSLLEKMNALYQTENTIVTSSTSKSFSKSYSPLNACLQNWYQPDDTIGLHADDEPYLQKEFPIFSLSWGGTRRFLFRSIANRKNKNKTKEFSSSSSEANYGKELVELWLEDGDLLVMGGTCQLTHKHEIPKRRITMDPPSTDRINWTIRAVKYGHEASR